MLLKVNKEFQNGNYMFTNNGGAIGTIRTGIKLPNNSILTGMWLQGAFLAGGVGCTISVGWISLDQDPAISSVAEFQPATVLAGYGSTIVAATKNPMAPFGSDIPYEIVVAIAVAPVTAGSLSIFCEYFNKDKTLF